MSLKISGISKTYGEKKAVNNIEFEAAEGKILGILGRNGAGKTTTIKSIMGIIEPDEGSITYDGKELKKSGVKIGYLPEERGLYLNSRVKDQLLYFGTLNGMSKREATKEICKRLNEFGISSYSTRKVKSLSKGNKQKIQLISAILHKPKIVILDEPFSGLDPVNIELFKGVVKRLRDEGTTILFSSHRMEDVEELCDYIVMIKEGKVIENDTIDGLIQKYSRDDEVEIKTDGNIEELIEKNNLEVVSIDFGTYTVRFKDKEDLNALYREILEQGLEVEKITNKKADMQTIFLKELGDNE